MAYAVTGEGELSLPKSLDGIQDSELMRIERGGYTGPRLRLAVLHQSGRFRMVERAEPGGIGWGGSGAPGATFSTFSTTPIGQAVLAAIAKGED